MNNFFRRIIYGKYYDSNTFTKYLKKKGIKIGENCRIFDPKSTLIDTQKPYMISIGNNVRITKGVIILTHDYSWSVASIIENKSYGDIGEVNIGNNVFIGMNSIILKNTNIGDNVIIGAGSIVHGNIESNSVYAANPAKRISSIEKYIEKLEARQNNDFKILVKKYTSTYQKVPTENDMMEYSWLFAEKINKDYEGQIRRTGNGNNIIENFFKREKKYTCFEDSLEKIYKSK